MSDEVTAGGSSPGVVCPWCSAPLAAADTITCSTCGAKIQGEGDQALPGLTAIDPLAVIEAARAPQRSRSRLVAWITGDESEEQAKEPASPEALAPPPPEVRREILRLRMEAELSQLSAEAEALVSDEAVAADEAGDKARAEAAVAAVVGADSTTDAVNEAAEQAAAEAEPTGTEAEQADGSARPPSSGASASPSEPDGSADPAADDTTIDVATADDASADDPTAEV